MAETLYSARYRPIAGLNTSLDPMALPDGAVSELENYRIRGGLLECRGGMTAALGTIEASATYRGHWAGDVNGTATIFVAILVSTAVRVYKSTDTTTWTEITAASGIYGNTRMSDAMVLMDVCPQPENGATSYLVMQNGTDTPRIYNGTYTFVATAIDPPLAVQDSPVKFILPSYFKIHDAGESTYTNSAGELEGADATLTGGTSSTDNVHRFTITTAAIDNDDFALVVMTTAMAGNTATDCVIVGVDTKIANLWDYFKLEIGTAIPGYSTVFDPTDDQYPDPIPVAFDLSGRTLWVFDMRGRWGDGYTPGANVIERYRLTYKSPRTSAPPPAGDPTFDIFAFALGGRFPGDTRFGITYELDLALESPGVKFSRYETPKIRDIGGPTVIYGNTALPLANDIHYGVKIPYQNTSTTARDLGVKTLRVYIKTADDFEYRRLDSKTIAAYAGSWAFSDSGTAPYTLYFTLTFGPTPSSTGYKFILPDAYHRPVPTGKGVKFTNSRLFVGSTSASVQGLAFSRRDHAFRFRTLPKLESGVFDEDAPANTTAIEGIPVAFLPVSASLYGSNQCFAFTPSGTFVFAGTNTSDILRSVARISNVGTLSPYSVASDSTGTIYFLDTSMQVRRMAGGAAQPISLQTVDNQLSAIPTTRRAYANGCVFDDIYRLYFSAAAGTTNTKGLWFDGKTGTGWSNDAPPVPVEGAVVWPTSTGRRFLTIGVAGGSLKIYEHDLATQSQDLGTTNITCSVTFAEMHAPDGKAIHINRVGITADDVASGTGTVTRTYKPGGSTGVGTISLDGSVNQIVRYDAAQTVTGDGKGISAKVRLSLGLTAGKKVYKVVAEVEPRDHGYDRST